MTLPILKGLQQDYLHSLYDEGIINDQFNKIHSLERTREPDCVMKVIEAYFGDVDAILTDLSSHIDLSNVDFGKLAALTHEIEDHSKSIGAEHVRLACCDLIQSCDEKNERKSALNLMWLRTEFSCTKEKLEAYVRMEQRIIRCMNSQSQASSSS